MLISARNAAVYVTNNRFADNFGVSAAVRLSALGGSNVRFSNNTVVNNFQPGLGGGLGGLLINGTATDLFFLTNNVLWNNGSGTGYDMSLSAPAILNNNLIGSFDPLPAGTVNNNTLSTDPGFTSGLNYRPRADSVLRNSGVTAVGQLPRDLDGNARVQGTRIDRGAYEFPEIFSNGFE